MYIQKQGPFKANQEFEGNIIHLGVHLNNNFEIEEDIENNLSPIIKIKYGENDDESFVIGKTGTFELDNIVIKKITILKDCIGYIEMEVEKDG